MQETLPSWNLDDLYDSPESDALKKDCASIERAVKEFVDDYRGVVTTISADALASAIIRYERIEDGLGKISSYADLLFAVESTDPDIAATYQNLQEYIQECSTQLVFFILELCKITEDELQAALRANQRLRHYEPWIRDVRAFRDYQLEESLEQLLIDKSGPANHAWIRLYEDICNRMKVTIDDEPITLVAALDLLSSPKPDIRKAAAVALSAAFADRSEQFGLIYNVVIKDKAIEDKWRGFARPVSSRNLANLVEDTIVDALVEQVKNNYANISHRYYHIKAKMLGLEKMEYWDRNAPLPDDDDRYIPWDEAKDIVLSAYREFSEELADIAQRFFDEQWIDAPVQDGKTSGAFSHPTVPSAHPYILMNYQGKVRDVMTLAHELGHGVHQVLAAEQGALMADTPLTLAETASVFGEQLTFQYLLKRESDPKIRNRLIASKIEDMINTVIRQIAFYEFETRMHAARAEGEVSVEAISQYWLDVQSESLGDAISLHDSYRYYWTYISHFYHVPFYVYAYAFGDCLVNSLYALYERENKAGRDQEFKQKYRDMLASGGSKRHKELLAPFGIDISRADFWKQGLDVITGYVDMLEQSLQQAA